MPSVPEEHRTLCEHCGYILEGLPPDAQCPECGTPVSRSTDPAIRHANAWETHPNPWTFLSTSIAILLWPSHFFRHMLTRSDTWHSRAFSHLWRIGCAILLALTILWHSQWLTSRNWGVTSSSTPAWMSLATTILKTFSIVWLYLAITVVNWMAAALTVWEASYRGIRLPRVAVDRGLRYHSVHLFIVCLLAAATVGFYRFYGSKTPGYDDLYLYTLCGEVILAAGYLFFTYWAAMRNMLYANR